MLVGAIMFWIRSTHMGALVLPEFNLNGVDVKASPIPFHEGHYERSYQAESTSTSVLIYAPQSLWPLKTLTVDPCW